MSRSRQHHAVVIGASMGGLAAARALAGHFDRVTVVDRDVIPEIAEPRKGVPQSRHAHALLGGGAQAIETLFPGILEEMVAAGAPLLDFNDGRWHQAGGYRAPSNMDRKVVGGSRPFIESHLRRRVRDLPNVLIETEVTVDGFAHEAGEVRGIRVHGADGPRTLMADLVVDCSGRASRAPQWLQELGYAAPEVAEVRCDVRYGTVVLRRTPTDLDAAFAIAIESPPYGKRSGFLLPIEGDRWIATIAACFGASAPVDLESFGTLAATLPSPELYDVFRNAEVIGDVMTHRLASSRRYRYERTKDAPTGFLALGDSICSFNPIYGQGMSSAVMQAVALDGSLATVGNSAQLAPTFYKRAAKVIDIPWQIAAGSDLAYPEAEGPRPLATPLLNRYMKRALLAAQVSPDVNTALLLVQNLMAAPSTLMRPAMVRKVLRGAREAEVRQQIRSGAHRRAPVEVFS